jgi:tetratricopeptide (TPR) repeat protein
MPSTFLRCVILLGAFLGLGTAAAQAAKPTADLVVARVTVTGSKVEVATKNAGKAKSAKSVTTVWLTKKGGALLGKSAVRALGARKSAEATLSVALPGGPGSYVVVACADAAGKVKESSEANNCKTAKLEVKGAQPTSPPATPQPAPGPGLAPEPTIAPIETPVPTATATPRPPPGDGANLWALDVSDPPATGREGETFRLADEVSNVGNAGAAAGAVRFYLSPDSETSLEERRTSQDEPRTALRDVRMGGAREVPALAPNQRSDSPAERTPVTIPIGIRPGTYHLLACADDRADVAESAEDDNCAVATHLENGAEKPTPITILAEEQPYRVDALSDIFDQPDEADDEADLTQLSQVFCKNPIPNTIHSLPEAIASIKRFLEEKAPGANAQFANSPEYQDATKAEEVAGAAITVNNPGAALAALVRAHELQPTQSSHLINAAAVASSVGLPGEALAMLDAANKLDDPDRPAMGIARHAVALANRGQALALLGKLQQADTTLDAALQADPLLTETNTSRAATTVCTQGPKPAVKFLRAGRKRQPPKPIDTSRGKETKLRDLQLPGFPKQAAEWRFFYSGQSDKLLAEITDQITRATAREASIAAKRGTWTRAQDRRYAATMIHIYHAPDEPDVHALDVKVDELLEKVINTQRDFWGDNEREDYEYRILSDAASKWCEASPYPRCFPQRMNDTCRPKLKLAHQTWLDQIQETYDAAQTFTRAATKRMSGYAANLADEDAHALGLIQIEQFERAVYGRVLQWAQHWTHSVELHKDHCVEALEPATGDPTAPAPGVESEAACSGLLKAMSGVFELGPMKLKISCERIQQSIKEEVIPWVQAYAEVTYDIRHGKLTVFGGTKGEISAGVGKGAFKSGIYVSTDRTGVMDVGWRVGPSATVGAGPVEFQVYKDEIDLSFVGAVSATLGL